MITMITLSYPYMADAHNIQTVQAATASSPSLRFSLPKCTCNKCIIHLLSIFISDMTYIVKYEVPPARK